LRDLGEEALPHFSATVVQQDRPVGVDMNQRTSLVQVRRRERNAELDRRQRDATLEMRAAPVPLADRVAALAVAGTDFELVDDLMNHIVDDGLLIVRDIALRLAVEIETAHVERVALQEARDLVDDL